MEPEKTRDYVGPVSNTVPWDHFYLRPGDIVLSTPPKSGTTWSQAILMMLIHGTAVTDRQVWHDSLWLDCALRDQDDIARQLNAQYHRRCIKSHAPFDGIPYTPGVTYLAVYRHPIDVHFSMKTHVERMTDDILGFLYTGDVTKDFRRFIEAPLTDSGTDDLTLRAIVHHYRSFQKFADREDVHLFHYADLRRNLPAAIARYAELTGIPASEGLVQEIAAACDFDTMKDVATKHSRPPGTMPWKHDGEFFAEGRSNKWEGRLSDDLVAAYEAELVDLVPDPSERAWLQWGEIGKPG